MRERHRSGCETAFVLHASKRRLYYSQSTSLNAGALFYTLERAVKVLHKDTAALAGSPFTKYQSDRLDHKDLRLKGSKEALSGTGSPSLSGSWKRLSTEYESALLVFLFIFLNQSSKSHFTLFTFTLLWLYVQTLLTVHSVELVLKIRLPSRSAAQATFL